MTRHADSPEQSGEHPSFGDPAASTRPASDTDEADESMYSDNLAEESPESLHHPSQHDASHDDASGSGHHAPDRTARVYVGLWLPSAGALIAYALMHGNYWAAFIGVELLLVGWFTLGKL